MKDCDVETLEDHLREILDVVSSDLAQPQSRSSSIEKSLNLSHATCTPSAEHGVARAKSGLLASQLACEFRALRSSVLRLWGDECEVVSTTPDDITRFNEAVDQAITESLVAHEVEVESWRQTFLGVLGHDLRGPLNAATLCAALLKKEVAPSLARHAAVLTRSLSRIGTMLDSLLELNRATHGVGMHLSKKKADLFQECVCELELLQAVYPITSLEVKGNSAFGEFDVSKVREAFANLVSNAIKHRDDAKDPQIRVYELDSDLVLSVENSGDIAGEDINHIFEPFKSGSFSQRSVDTPHLGLGLFITQQIAKAHDGEVSVTSKDGVVKFMMTLPKA